jgi:muramidase (phage lysozyme)
LQKDEGGIILKDNTPTGFQTIDDEGERYATLSWGLFDEVHEPKDVERYGRALFDTKTRKIVALSEVDSLYNHYPMDIGVFAMAVDPLTKGYPMLTPYQFASNTPIQAIDLEGLEMFYAADGNLLGKIGTSTQVRLINEEKITIEQAQQMINFANNNGLTSEDVASYADKYSEDVGLTYEELNVRATLGMIKQAEAGRVNAALDYNAWNAGDNFTESSYKDAPEDYANHPGSNPNNGRTSAGAYQFMERFWTGDFSPISQDKAAVEGIDYRGALDDAMSGNVANIKSKLSSHWTSLEHYSTSQLQEYFDKYIKDEINGNSNIATPKGELLED